MSAIPQCKCPNNEVVVSSAGGKDFFYCRGCKSEVVLEPETNRDEGPISIWGQSGASGGSGGSGSLKLWTDAQGHTWRSTPAVGYCLSCSIHHHTTPNYMCSGRLGKPAQVSAPAPANPKPADYVSLTSLCLGNYDRDCYPIDLDAGREESEDDC